MLSRTALPKSLQAKVALTFANHLFQLWGVLRHTWYTCWGWKLLPEIIVRIAIQDLNSTSTSTWWGPHPYFWLSRKMTKLPSTGYLTAGLLVLVVFGEKKNEFTFIECSFTKVCILVVREIHLHEHRFGFQAANISFILNIKKKKSVEITISSKVDASCIQLEL